MPGGSPRSCPRGSHKPTNLRFKENRHAFLRLSALLFGNRVWVGSFPPIAGPLAARHHSVDERRRSRGAPLGSPGLFFVVLGNSLFRITRRVQSSHFENSSSNYFDPKIRFGVKLETSTTDKFGYQKRKSGVDSESVRKTLRVNQLCFTRKRFVADHHGFLSVWTPPGSTFT